MLYDKIERESKRLYSEVYTKPNKLPDLMPFMYSVNTQLILKSDSL